MADNVKELMEENDYKEIDNADCATESYVAHGDFVVSINDLSKTIAVADFRKMQFVKFDSDFIKLLYDMCIVKGWI